MLVIKYKALRKRLVTRGQAGRTGPWLTVAVQKYVGGLEVTMQHHPFASAVAYVSETVASGHYKIETK